MTAPAPYMSSFLREHLHKWRRASQHTCAAYAHSFQLLLCFAASRLKIKPANIEIEWLDAPLVLAFLEHLDKKRGNSARTHATPGSPRSTRSSDGTTMINSGPGIGLDTTF